MATIQLIMWQDHTRSVLDLIICFLLLDHLTGYYARKECSLDASWSTSGVSNIEPRPPAKK